MLSDEWLSRYELLKNLHRKLCHSVKGTRTRKRTTGVTTIAHLVLRTGELKIVSYQKPFRRDRKENGGGGISIYAQNGVCCKRRFDLENEHLECIWLEVKPVKSKSFLVGNIYRPPNSGIIWNEIFEDSIENILKEEKELYLLGRY